MQFSMNTIRTHEGIKSWAGETGNAGNRGTIEALEGRLERQNLLIQALAMLLIEKKLVAEDELHEWLKYVDGLDGRADGRLGENKSPQKCEACSRMNSAGAVRCQYCGKDFGVPAIDARHKVGKRE